MDNEIFFVLHDFIQTLHPAKTQVYELVTTFLKRHPEIAENSVVRAQPRLPLRGAKPIACGTIDVVICVVREALRRWPKSEEVQHFVSGGDEDSEVQTFRELVEDKSTLAFA